VFVVRVIADVHYPVQGILMSILTHRLSGSLCPQNEIEKISISDAKDSYSIIGCTIFEGLCHEIAL